MAQRETAPIPSQPKPEAPQDTDVGFLLNPIRKGWTRFVRFRKAGGTQPMTALGA
jgi:hypothetical protein